MKQKDYYTVLGVPEDAGEARIKKSYRDLAKRYHPDRNAGDPAAESRFKEIQEAYDVLGEPEKRRKYDQLRKYGGGGGVNLEDLFGGGGAAGGGFGGSIFDLFERAGVGRRRGPAGPRRGDDLRHEVSVPFETAAFGGTRSIVVERTGQCPRCGGSGAEAGSRPETCPACHGSGTAATAQGAFSFSRPCPQCMGKGSVIRKPCQPCRGSGLTAVQKSIAVKIPTGVNDGATIRLRGEGDPGERGGPSGDLLLTVRVRGHGSFKRNGLDIESELEIDMADAALGTKREVETLAGRIELTVPAGIQPNAKLRLPGRGVKNHRGGTGDHFVRIRVMVPKKLTAKQKELLEAFRREESGTGK
jgi:molecular chaperone DnaJ